MLKILDSKTGAIPQDQCKISVFNWKPSKLEFSSRKLEDGIGKGVPLMVFACVAGPPCTAAREPGFLALFQRHGDSEWTDAGLRK
jgi:hypothetical protein